MSLLRSGDLEQIQKDWAKAEAERIARALGCSIDDPEVAKRILEIKGWRRCLCRVHGAVVINRFDQKE